jgi:hypothetical protein
MTITLSQFCQEQGALKEFMVWKLGLIENLKYLKWDLKCQLYWIWYSLAHWKKIHKFMQRGACSIQFGNWYSLGVFNVWSEIWNVKSFLNSIYFGSLERIHKSKKFFVQLKMELDLDHPREVSNWWGWSRPSTDN